MVSLSIYFEVMKVPLYKAMKNQPLGGRFHNGLKDLGAQSPVQDTEI